MDTVTVDTQKPVQSTGGVNPVERDALDELIGDIDEGAVESAPSSTKKKRTTLAVVDGAGVTQLVASGVAKERETEDTAEVVEPVEPECANFAHSTDGEVAAVPDEPKVEELSIDERPVEAKVEDPTWTALRASCPLWGIGVLFKVTREVQAQMNLRRRSAGDQIVVDLTAWGVIYRLAVREKRGREVEKMSGYGRSMLDLGQRMADKVDENGGAIPTEWLGLGTHGVRELIKGPPKAKKGKTDMGAGGDASTPIDVKADGKALRAVVAHLADPAVRVALKADPDSAKRAANAAINVAISAIYLLDPKVAKATLKKLAKEATGRANAYNESAFALKPKSDGGYAPPEGGNIIDLFGDIPPEK